MDGEPTAGGRLVELHERSRRPPPEPIDILAASSKAMSSARAGFLDDPSALHLHALRGAIRRLGVQIDFFAPWIPPADVKWLVGELEWQARCLGRCRDLDVLIARLGAKHPYTGEFRPADLLIASAQAARRDAADQCLQTLNSARATFVSDGLSSAIHRGMITSPPTIDLRGLADAVFDQADRKILRKGRHVRSMGRRKRHKLRNEIRRLRYLLEALPDGTPEEGVYVATLIGFQTLLGDMNDDALCIRHSLHLTHCGDLDVVPGLEPGLFERQRKELKPVWKRFKGLVRPWPSVVSRAPPESCKGPRAG